jgi:hypothetical protein
VEKEEEDTGSSGSYDKGFDKGGGKGSYDKGFDKAGDKGSYDKDGYGKGSDKGGYDKGGYDTGGIKVRDRGVPATPPEDAGAGRRRWGGLEVLLAFVGGV